jgi:hypothetical protein
MQHFFKQTKAGKSSYEFFYLEDAPLRASFYVLVISPKQSNLKGPVRASQYASLYLESITQIAHADIRYVSTPPTPVQYPPDSCCGRYF